jgi:hypothetical protein
MLNADLSPNPSPTLERGIIPIDFKNDTNCEGVRW